MVNRSIVNGTSFSDRRSGVPRAKDFASFAGVQVDMEVHIAQDVEYVIDENSE
jgi:hypothetical protein